jgi:DNA-binding CsgD family transcriptional regulator
LQEIALTALDAAGTAALAARQLGQALSPALAVRLFTQTEGVPFFVEAIAVALRTSQRLHLGPSGLELVRPEDLPLPESVRDAVLLRLDSLSTRGQEALEIAAVAGLQVNLALAAELAGSDEGLGEALAAGLLLEVGPGQASFRHALIREAVYSEIAWSRRRGLHRQMAERLEANAGRAPVPELAEHWLAAHELRRGRLALLALAEAWCGVHAYRDASFAIRRAMEVWPGDEDELLRLEVLDRLGMCAQMSGDLTEATRAWRQAAEGRREAGDQPRLADAQRRLASLYELQNQWEPAMAARQQAAEAFDRSQMPGEAAAERLSIAEHLSLAAHYDAAVEEATRAVEGAVRAERVDLQASGLAAKGKALANLGQYEAGRQIVQAALSLALAHNLIGPASQAYYSLADVLEKSGDYAGSRDTFQTSIEFCQTVGQSVMEQICLACLGVVQREMGEWERARRLCQEVLAAPDAQHVARLVAQSMIGSIMGWRGQARRARSLLLPIPDEARRLEKASLEIDSTFALACVEELLGNQAAAVARYRAILQLAEQREERHYVVPALRWGATFFASLNAPEETRACARALAAIASVTGKPEAMAALAHALGEAALLEGDSRLAVSQFSQALDALGDAELPFDRAQILFRTGAALRAAGERQAAVERLVSAYHTARKLRAHPLARQAAQALADLGEPIERRAGRRAASQLTQAGLSARELEVLRHIRLGQTNRDIAQSLFLSPRTVDMHVRNLLAKLDVRSRAEAVGRASELGLLA